MKKEVFITVVERCENDILMYSPNRRLAQLLSAHVIGAGSLGFNFRVGQIGTVSPTARPPLRRSFGAV